MPSLSSECVGPIADQIDDAAWDAMVAAAAKVLWESGLLHTTEREPDQVLVSMMLQAALAAGYPRSDCPTTTMLHSPTS